MDKGELILRTKALDYLRRLTALAYREIGVLKPMNHKAIYDKAKLSSEFFGPKRKELAKQLYRLTLSETAPDKIANRHLSKTGLSLEDVLTAFEKGKWGNASGGVSFGGPKWAQIVRSTI